MVGVFDGVMIGVLLGASVTIGVGVGVATTPFSTVTFDTPSVVDPGQ